jgi:hypothetical protein
MNAPDQTNIVGLVDLYEIAVQLVEKFVQLDASQNFGLYSTFYLARSLGVAAVVILKLYRSWLSTHLSKDRGERCYFAAVRLLRRRASDIPDLDSRLATILTELWSSTAAFRDAAGNTDSLYVRVRTRLVRYLYPAILDDTTF